MKDIIVKENYFDHDQIHAMHNELELYGPKEVFVDHFGIHKGKTVSEQIFVDPDDIPDITQSVINHALKIFKSPVIITEIVYSTLYLPWDIHADLSGSADHTNLANNRKPYYNMLIPFQDVESRTIIFNQQADKYDAFYKYKENNPPLDNPETLESWNQYLDMCWPDDRRWLTIKEVLPTQRLGQLIAFKRQLYHSSDNFHSKNVGPKKFLQILTDLV